MAANICTSSTSTITGTDPNFTLTHKVYNKEDGVFLYVKYTIGTTTSLVITPKTICQKLSSTDQYNLVSESSMTLSALAYTLTAAGNYKIPIPVTQHDETLVITLVLSGAGLDAAVVANIMEA